MSKKKWLVVGGAVVILVIVLVALQLMSDKPGSSDTPGTGGTTSATSTVDPGKTTTGTAVPSSSTTNAPPANPGALSALKPFPKTADPGIPAVKASAPAAEGKTLAPLLEAPADTISALKLGLVPDGTRYDIEMRPYGIGPDIALGSRLAIRVDSMTSVGGAPTLSQLVNANVLVLMDTTHDGAVSKGGAYTAKLTFRSDGAQLLPIISEVVAVP